MQIYLRIRFGIMTREMIMAISSNDVSQFLNELLKLDRINNEQPYKQYPHLHVYQSKINSISYANSLIYSSHNTGSCKNVHRKINRYVKTRACSC